MSRFVIVSYTPKEGQEKDLLAAIEKHMEVLREQHLVTDKAAYVMRATNGSILEVFEWRSSEAIEQAHSNSAVQALWADFEAVCEYTPLAQLDEAKNMFAEFEAVEL